MKSLLPAMSQWIDHSTTFSKLELALGRYGQLIIYLLALGVIGVFYMVAQKAFATYLESLQDIQIIPF